MSEHMLTRLKGSTFDETVSYIAGLEAERDRLREFVEDLAEGWVGNVRGRAERVLDDE